MSCLAGHAALITGSTKGVGRAIAEAYAAAGADVVLHGRSESTEAKDALAACRSHGIQASFVAADLSEPQAACVPKLAADARKACPQLDILVNYAGHYFDVPCAQMTLERFNKTIDLNVTSGCKNLPDTGLPTASTAVCTSSAQSTGVWLRPIRRLMIFRKAQLK